ncbi:MAG: hypothetical protein J6X06_03865 [Elusimicrobiaceae bacterium]|nr:hypothetical protein [Elusimicrobiaceae bacterium]
MKKPILMFAVLSCFLSNIPAAALAADKLQQAVTQRVEGLASTQTPGPITSWYGLPVITWDHLEQSIYKFTKRMEQVNLLENVLLQLQHNEIATSINQQLQQGSPDYKTAIANKKYIYIGETHDFPIVQETIFKLLRVIRQENPNKKILLATEFLESKHPLFSPLFPEGKIILAKEGYPGLLARADHLQMDLLALDDEIIQMLPDGSDLIKIGQKYLHTDIRFDFRAQQLLNPFLQSIKEEVEETDLAHSDSCLFETLYQAKTPADFQAAPRRQLSPEETAIITPGSELFWQVYFQCFYSDEKKPQLTQEQVLRLYKAQRLMELIKASEWGAVERNKQWHKHLEEVQANYDIVIVWVGSGHLEGRAFSHPSLTRLLNHPESSVEIHIQPAEMAKMDSDDGYKQRGEWLEDQGLALQDEFTHIDKEPLVDFSKPFFIKLTAPVKEKKEPQSAKSIEDFTWEQPRKDFMEQVLIDRMEQYIEAPANSQEPIRTLYIVNVK